MTRLVNSWNEWDPLRRIIVGRPEGTCTPAPDPGDWYLDYTADVDTPDLRIGPKSEEDVAAAAEQIDAFAALLESRGVVVDRVTIHPSMAGQQPISTPEWSALYQYGANNPRDIALVIGNEIMEVPCCKRSRWYEYLSLRPLLEQYLKEDPDFLWTSAPRPRLTDDSFVGGYFHDYFSVWTDEEKVTRLNDWAFQMTEVEPLFDAADGVRCGKDIFWMASCTTNRTGVDWLRRYFEPKGMRIHVVQYAGDTRPYHSDANLAFLRPGLAVYNPEWPPVTDELFELLKRNDWDLIPAEPMPQAEGAPPAEFLMDSAWSAVNSLSLDPDTVCCAAHHTAHMEMLEKRGFEVIPVPYRKAIKFGGSVHCTTLDVYREGSCEDYFPNQVKRF